MKTYQKNVKTVHVLSRWFRSGGTRHSAGNAPSVLPGTVAAGATIRRFNNYSLQFDIVIAGKLW